MNKEYTWMLIIFVMGLALNSFICNYRISSIIENEKILTAVIEDMVDGKLSQCGI